MKEGYFINANDFKQEKEKFYSEHPQSNQEAKDFIEKLKGICQFKKDQVKIQQMNVNAISFADKRLNTR